MPLSPNDMDRLILAINRNTAAQLAAAAMVGPARKSGRRATTKAAVSSTSTDFLKEIQIAPTP